MSECHYGVDRSKPITGVVVRDAIIKCFLDAHQAALEDFAEYAGEMEEQELEKMKQIHVESMIKKTFDDIGGNFDSPTKEELRKVVMKLKDFAANFRDTSLVEKHATEIMSLIEELE